MVGERKTLAKIAKERGHNSVDAMLKNEIERHGSIIQASTSIGVAMSAIQMWLSRNGYKVVKTVSATIQKKEVA